MVTEVDIRRGIDQLIADGRAVHAIVDGQPGIQLVELKEGLISEYDGLGKCSLCSEAHSPLKACPGTEDLTCMFCGNPVGGNFVTDDNEGIACKECATDEIAAQRAEGHR